jgi:hypothetical protein
VTTLASVVTSVLRLRRALLLASLEDAHLPMPSVSEPIATYFGACPLTLLTEVLGLVDQLCSAVLSGGGAGGSSSAAQASTTSTILLTTTTTEPSTTAATTTVVDTTVSTSVVSTSVVPATNTTSVIGTGSMMPSVTKTPSPTATPPIQVNGASQFHVGMSLMGAVLVGALAL